MRARLNWIFVMLALALALTLLTLPSVIGDIGEQSSMNISVSYPLYGDSLYSMSVPVNFSLNESGNFSCAIEAYCGGILNSFVNASVESLSENSVNSVNSMAIQLENCSSYVSYDARISCSNENYSGSSDSLPFNVFEAPYVVLSAPDENANLNSESINSLHFDYSIGPSGSEPLIKSCSLYIDGNESMSSSSVSNGTNSFEYNVSEGTHSWKVSCALIGSSEEIVESEERQFFSDFTAPSFSLISPALQAYDEKSIEFILNATDSFSENISCTAAGLPNISSFIVQSGIPYVSSITAPSGNYTFSIACTDFSGNTASLSGYFESIDFSISVDNSSYLPEQNVFISVAAPQSSRVNLTVSKGNLSISSLTSPPYPITYIFYSTYEIGNYTISAILSYGNRSFYRNSSFNVASPGKINVSIGANVSSAEPGASIRFTSNVSGNLKPVSYSWDFNSDGIAESTSIAPVYSYSSAGTYKAKLTVNDSYTSSSAEKEIKILRRAAINVISKSEEGEPIRANVTLGNKTITANSSGEALFTNVLEGSYVLNSTADGFYSYSNDIEISENRNITLYLTDIPIIPDVQISSPPDGAAISSSDIQFKFRVIHRYSTNCTLYSNEGMSWWSVLGNASDVLNNTERSISVSGLNSKNYEFKLVCKDKFGNSGVEQISINASVASAASGASEGVYPELDSAEEALESSSVYYNSLGPAELEAAKALGIPEALADANSRLERARRDISDLSFSRKTDEEIAARKREIIADAVSSVDSIPLSIELLGSSDFIKYPKEAELSEISGAFIAKKGLAIDERTFLRANSGIQQLFSVNTKAFSVALTYENSRREITVVTHKINLKEDIKNNASVLSNLMLVLYVPKNVTDSASKINMSSDYSVIKDDPILEIPISDNITYTIDGSFNLNNAPSISLLLVQKSASVPIPGITGMAVSDKTVIWPFNLISGRLGSSFGLQLFILIALIAIYLGYTFIPEGRYTKLSEFKGAVSGKFHRSFSRKEAASQGYSEHKSAHNAANQMELHQMEPNFEEQGMGSYEPQMGRQESLSGNNYALTYSQMGASPASGNRIPAAAGMQYSYAFSLLEKARNLTLENKYDEASSSYYELRLIYGSLSPDLKRTLYPQMINLFHQLNFCYMKNLLSSAKSLISEGDYREAALVYEKIEKTYKILPKEMKYPIFMDCFNIITSLEKNKDMIYSQKQQGQQKQQKHDIHEKHDVHERHQELSKKLNSKTSSKIAGKISSKKSRGGALKSRRN